MEKRIHYYVSRKSFFTWLSAFIMLLSAGLRLAYFCEKGAEYTTLWFQIVLPVAACLIFGLILLLSGEEHLYRTAVPVTVYLVCYAVQFGAALPLHLRFIFWIAVLAVAMFYSVSISGKFKSLFPMAAIFAATLCILLYIYRNALLHHDLRAVFPVSCDMAALFGLLVTLLSARIHLDNAFHPTWGDRCDGRRLRTLDPITVVATYIMPNRNGSSNAVRDSIEITPMERYIREKRKAGYTGFGINHVFLAAYVRCVAKYPAVNRFLSGQRVYSRDEDVQFCMVVKSEMTTDSSESIAKIHLNPADTSIVVYEKLKKAVEEIQGQAIGGSNFDKTAKYLSLIPGVIFKFVVWLLKLMDYFGLIPKFLLEISPFHGSVFFTSMGSLGIPPVTHHLYDFGNLPVFCSFGCKRHATELLSDGTVVQRKYVDFTFNTDERIVDGFYFAAVLKYLKKLLSHPELLDVPPEEVVRDID